jgi:hypothetical protein
MNLAILELSIPLSAVIGSPSIRFIFVIMTLNTGIGCFELIREVRTRHPHAVVTTWIDDHVSALHHVTFHTEVSCGIIFVEVMRMYSIFFLKMASVAKGIPLDKDFTAMGLMAISAAYTGLVHLTLQERSVNIDLFIDLTVRVVKLLLQDTRHVCIQKRPVVHVRFVGESPSCMTPGAHLYKSLGLFGDCPFCRALFGIFKHPSGTIGLLQTDGQTQITCRLVPLSFVCGFGPFDMLRSWAVAGFTGNIDLRPDGVVFLLEAVILFT